MTDATRFTALAEATESLLGRLADEFHESCQRGERPSIEELAERYPQLADVIRQVFPAMLLLPVPADTAAIETEFPGGKDLGDFRIVREIGRGGMGLVYEAFQHSLGRRVALKVLPLAAILDERHLRRFQNEAHAVAVLQHPHIVSVYGVGCERGVHYYAMQLIDGLSLAEVLRRVNAPQEPGAPVDADASTAAYAMFSTQGSRGHDRYRAIANLGIQAAEALAYAHREGVVHRDIKPSNLLLDRQGKLWVTDFGLARIQSGGELTQTGDVLGTLRYMSPEQLTDNKVVDQRTDVYSLGLTLYEVLARRPAFANVPREQLPQKIFGDEPTPLKKLDPAIPVDLETILLRATAKDREARYQSADELAADLRRFIEHKPVLARRLTRWQRLRYWSRRNPALATTLATLFLAMTVLSIGGPAMAWRQALTARDYRRQLDIADLNVAYDAWYAGNVNQAEDLLQRHAAETDVDDHRSFPWRFLRSEFAKSQNNIICRHEGGVNDVAVSPDGEVVASAGEDRRVVFTDLKTHRQRRSWLAHAKGVTGLDYGPSGAWLATSGAEGSVKLWNVAGAPELIAALPCDSKVTALEVAPSGEIVVAGTDEGRLYAWTSTGQPNWSLAAHQQKIYDLAFSPNGEFVATAGDDNCAQVRRSQSGELVRAFDDHRVMVFAVAFSLAGDKLYTGAADGLSVWNLRSGTELAGFDSWTDVPESMAVAKTGLLATGAHGRFVTFWDESSGHRLSALPGNRDTVSSMAFTPDDEQLLTGGEDGTVRIFDAREAQELRERWQQLKSYKWGTLFALSPNGQILLSTSFRGNPGEPNPPNGELIFWDVATGSPRVTHSTAMREAYHVAISPDGRRAASCGLGGVRLWDVASGQPLEALYDSAEHCLLYVAFSPDGRWLATGGRNAPKEKDADGLALLWDLSQDPPRRIELDLDNPAWKLQVVCFTADSQHLALAGDQSWRDGSVDLWELTDNAWIRSRGDLIRMDGRITSISPIPASDRLVVTSWLGETVIQDIHHQTPERRFRGHTKDIYSSAVSADGKLLATGGFPDIKFWDVATGDQLGALTTPMWVSSIAFTPDGQTLIWGGGDGSVHFERAGP